ncbi:hypothetical protein CFP65_6985 [Kitasatospora sp. MMS16-BH015]|uniref:cofilin family protein n=1 Tax=Kitasatospora sp. MMS16-BH015 TaxID=2018025 RepID=UPI000CA1306F|nr:cofilin family protein [Kitasatospora sp. MMS16-BH015]AUG81597.1 hypothetical protein CFP65_6985 [Kitasatospora sp. MMS16-BH015]
MHPKVDDSALGAFMAVQADEVGHAVFRLSEDWSRILVEATGGGAVRRLARSLPLTSPRFIAVKVPHGAGAGARSRLLFLTWNPVGASVRDRLLATCIRDRVRMQLYGVEGHFEVTDQEQLVVLTEMETPGP